MKQRVITGTAFALLVLAGIFFRGWVMFILLSAALIMSVEEVYRAIRNTGIEPVRWAGYMYCGLTIAAFLVSFFVNRNTPLQMIALLLAVMAAMIRLVSRGKIAVESLMATVFPMLYPGIFYMVLMELLRLGSNAEITVALVLAFFADSVNDVFALFSGLLFGKHKLSPELSPKKTVEGAIGGLIFSVLFCMIVPTLVRLVFSFDPAFAEGIAALPPAWAFGILGLVCGALSQVGDLTASMIKRHCGVKDFGALLPGHGGMMDRMDGILFSAAACYIFFKVIKII